MRLYNEMCIFIEGYKQKNSAVRHLLKQAAIHLIPLINPDSYSMGQPGDCTGKHFTGVDISFEFSDEGKVRLILSCI